MTNIVEVENRMITLRGQQVILDSDTENRNAVDTAELIPGDLESAVDLRCQPCAPGDPHRQE